jgi:hypothetical protein
MAFSDWIANTFYGAGDLQAESDRLDAERARLNESRRATYGDAWYQDTLNNDEAGRVDAAGQIGEEFTAEALQRNLEESTASASGWARSIIGAPLSFVFRSIPVLGWVVIAGLVFWWLGGPAWVRAWVARRSR